MQVPNILIVDDDQGVREVIVAAAKGGVPDARVVEAKDGTEAEWKVRNQDFDLVVTDIRMPGLSGIGLLRVIGSLTKKPKMIIVSGFVDKTEEIEGKLGIPVLSKPLELQELAQAIQKQLGLPMAGIRQQSDALAAIDEVMAGYQVGELVVSKVSLNWGYGTVKGNDEKKGLVLVAFSHPPKGLEGKIIPVNPQNLIKEAQLTETQRKRIESKM